MTDLQAVKYLPFNKSYYKVIEDLYKWRRQILSKFDDMYDNILDDMSRTFDDIHYFVSFTNALLVEQEIQLEKATSNEEIDIIEERINQIITEIQFLQSLSFRLNFDSIKLNDKLRIDYNNRQIKSSSIFSSFVPPINYNYRLLISRMDAIELEKHFLPSFHLTSYDNESINECVLTFNVNNLLSFINAFNSYWNLFPNNNEIRMLIPQYNISFIIGKLGETSRLIAKRFQLDQIKVFVNLCPKSDERILLINGKQRDLIRDCIEEIYYNIEEKNKKDFTNKNIQFYNPANLSIDDINKIVITNVDYGGYIRTPTRSLSVSHSRLHQTEDEESSDDDLWNENDDWWNFRDDNFESTQREMIISNIYAGVIIGVNARRIDRIKQKTGAYVYINGETSDLKRTVIMKGTRRQVDRAYACIENLIEKHKNGKLPIKQRSSYGKRKEK